MKECWGFRKKGNTQTNKKRRGEFRRAQEIYIREGVLSRREIANHLCQDIAMLVLNCLAGW